jgi:hypothetical protein
VVWERKVFTMDEKQLEETLRRYASELAKLPVSPAIMELCHRIQQGLIARHIEKSGAPVPANNNHPDGTADRNEEI